MYNKQIPKRMPMGSLLSSDEDIVELLRPLAAKPSEIEFYNDMTNDPTRISGTIVTSQILEGRLVETRTYGCQTLYAPEYGLIHAKERDPSFLDMPIRRPSTRTIASAVGMDSGFITHGYFDYAHPCPEQTNLKTLLKEIRYDMDYLAKISEFQHEDSLIPTVVADLVPIKGQESLESSLLDVVGYDDHVPVAKSQSVHSRVTIYTTPMMPNEDNKHFDECILDKKPYNVECQDEECGIIDSPDTEIPMDEYTLARRKIAVLPPEKQLKVAVEYLRERGDALGVLPDIDKVPWLTRWYEIRRNFKVKLTPEVKDQLMDDSVKIWDTPYFRITNIPIPDFPMKKLVNWDCIKQVKAKAEELNNKYQRKVRQQMVTNARNFFPSMKVEYFKSPLNQSFRRTYFDYEPSKEADCLTIKPWRKGETHIKDQGDCGRIGNCKRQNLMNQM